ncbi:DUF4339 domain-containing protein [Akkermansia glycaniphila]|uniref:DUF4339 domain-containing protein n=1 Tax=Akkermansia glycaniphila TaxID=1679444 RepID=UPI001C02956C|nr:DUF4339 domain-containing protein [Akkermansia glycaniphila]MBT9450627.1 DUF4339 domain-containing protein [Akkermansia glycaniphila]
MTRYYYDENGQATGPVTVQELRSLYDNGKVHPHTMIMEAGGSSWRTMEQVFPDSRTPSMCNPHRLFVFISRLVNVLYACIPLGAIGCIYIQSKTNDMQVLLFGGGIILLLLTAVAILRFLLFAIDWMREQARHIRP